jgi:hypothetical protein
MALGLGLNLGLSRPQPATGGGGDPSEALDAILAAMTLDLNPIEANITKDGNDLIAQWDETGTVGGSYVQATEGNKLLWEADGGNGKPCATIQDAGDSMARSANTPYNTYFATGAAFQIFVLQTDIITGNDTIMSCAVVTGTTGRLRLDRNSAAFRGFHYDGTSDFGASANQSVDTRLIGALRHLGGNVGISINGGAWVEGTSGDTATPTTDAAWIIGTDNAGANPGKLFRIAGNVAYPGDEDYAALVALLAEVYGVTV